MEKACRVLNDGMTNQEDYWRRGRLMFDMRVMAEILDGVVVRRRGPRTPNCG